MNPCLACCQTWFDARARRNARIPKWEKDEPKKRDLLPPEAWKIHLRDLVEVIAGPDQRKQGKVIKTEPKKMQVYVEGCNMRPVSELDKVTNPDRPRYAKVLKEAPLHYSDVMLVDPVDKRRCRVKYAYLESGKRVRLSARSGAGGALPTCLPHALGHLPPRAFPLDHPSLTLVPGRSHSTGAKGFRSGARGSASEDVARFHNEEGRCPRAYVCAAVVRSIRFDGREGGHAR